MVASTLCPDLENHHYRVSIPFIAGQWSLQERAKAEAKARRAGFNPLHCGAVVASAEARAGRLGAEVVSIPFIAGQWSLLAGPGVFPAWTRGFQSPSLRGSGRFLPPSSLVRWELHVSIPFIAGQWSLREGRGGACADDALFQSPSLRGSGRFTSAQAPPAPAHSCFNPLHCGAVVASRRRPPPHGGAAGGFQSPSLRGSGRFSHGKPGYPPTRRSFNPLHCGAVVASHGRSGLPPSRRRVSIPFIAGQWSLRMNNVDVLRCARLFQSPSLQGSGRFWRRGKEEKMEALCFNPLHCGAVVASGSQSPQRCRAPSWFQSPSLRGSGRFAESRTEIAQSISEFQSPSLRGSGRFGSRHRNSRGFAFCFNPLHCGAVVASSSGDESPFGPPCFNPLHCGAVVASRRNVVKSIPPGCVSIPFIAGQWSLRLSLAWGSRVSAAFQSPSLRGSGRFWPLSGPSDSSNRVSIPFIAGQWSLPHLVLCQA